MIFKLLSLTGFKIIWYSSTLPPPTPISEIPEILDKNGFTVYSAIFLKSIWLYPFPEIENPIIGKMDGFILSIEISIPCGRFCLISFILASIRCLSKLISEFQSKKAEISQLPLLVALRIKFIPGTLLIAFSSGTVTVTVILSTGCSPLSAIILTLGKVIFGNNADWICVKE